MSDDTTKLKEWFTLRDIYNFKYECRRYLDMLVGLRNRELENIRGTAEDNGYFECYDTSVATWKKEKTKKQKENAEPRVAFYEEPQSNLKKKKKIDTPIYTMKSPLIVTHNTFDTTPEVSPL
jgi:hypothetical protein